MLEGYGLEVDSSESAEAALEFLRQGRPDVIFMDHLMPGMDGFQAVQAIKADPLTATIPLMMYTSQEGELYVSQARALGAVGVLPKTVRPVDVSRILYQLHLLPDRRTQRTALFPGPAAAAAKAVENGHGDDASMAAALAAATQAEGDGGETASGLRPAVAPLGMPTPAETSPPAAMAFTPAVAHELQSGLRQSMHQLVTDQLAEQRRFVLATFEAFARRMQGELREAIARIPPPPALESLVAPAPQRQWWPVVMTALLAVIPAVVLGYMMWQTSMTNERLARELVETRGVAERAKADAIAAAAAASATVASNDPLSAALPQPAGGAVATEYVPYGETPFSGNRLERLRALASTLENQRFKGTIRIESFVGDFCLAGTAGENLAVATGDTPIGKCDLVGNPFDDGLSNAQRQSLEFANYAAMLRRRTDGNIRVDVVAAGRRDPIAYPEQDEKTTAAAWNVVAAQNNRVEFHLVPAGA
jgi:CheY-like chemotaxis protein